MIKNSRIYTISIILALLAAAAIVFYLSFLKETKETFIHNNYKKRSDSLRLNIENMIDAKRKSTLGLALTLADHDEKLAEYIKKGSIPKGYYNDLVYTYARNTLYKNIWIQVLDTKGVSLYRSWSNYKGDDLSKVREDVRQALQLKKPLMSMSTGQFDISLKSIAPIFERGHFLGLVEVISHFNSITKVLHKAGIESIVVADARFKERLKHPWNRIFIDDYYVSNLTANKKLIDYLSDHGIKNYLNNSYKVENGYLITSYLLMDNNEIKGAFIMFEKLSNISSEGIDEFILRWLLFGIFVIILIVIVGNVGLYYVTIKQKKYYKSIIDSSGNIVLTNDGNTLTDANKAFFKYFQSYKTLKDFTKEHSCICDFFVNEKGYLQKEMDGMNWVEYLLAHQDKDNKVKMNIEGSYYYFLISASVISEKPLQIAIILADITEQELYKHELEERTMTDPLTGIKNRRFYESRIQYEIARSCRYEEPLSIIMFDIDHFKQVNDIHGHDVGDKVLIEYTALISSMLRATDVLCRIGGEEFIIITPHTSAIDAYKLAEKIRKSVERAKRILQITMSFGVTQHKDDEDKDSMFKRADRALYEAKESGRNKVVIG